LSYKLSVLDALIAATSIRNDLPLYTLNIKDFRFISDLRLYTPQVELSWRAEIYGTINAHCYSLQGSTSTLFHRRKPGL
jgi:hypothetical protein